MFCFYRTAVNAICVALFCCGCGKPRNLIKDTGHLDCSSVNLLRYYTLLEKSHLCIQTASQWESCSVFYADQAVVLLFLLIRKKIFLWFQRITWSSLLLVFFSCGLCYFVFSWLHEATSVTVSAAVLQFLCCYQIFCFLGWAKLSKTRVKSQ